MAKKGTLAEKATELEAAVAGLFTGTPAAAAPVKKAKRKAKKAKKAKKAAKKTVKKAKKAPRKAKKSRRKKAGR